MSLADMLFVVDLGACTGCQTCAVACLDRANAGDAGLGDDAWLLRLHTQETGHFPTVQVQFRIVHCWHCAQPACVSACAFAALIQGADGLVALDRTLCTGCGACVEACPFGAVHLLAAGLAAKCDGCPDEAEAGREPVCVRACPMRALALGSADIFGDRPRQPDTAFDAHGLAPRVRFLQRRTSAPVERAAR